MLPRILKVFVIHPGGGGIRNIIGAIDGCHIKISRPKCHGDSEGYFSILLQEICDENAKFIDVFVGPPGRVHDARMLRQRSAGPSCDFCGCRGHIQRDCRAYGDAQRKARSHLN